MLRFPAALLLAVLLTGCATQPARITTTSEGGELSQLQQWQASGRLGVSTDNGGGSGSFDWHQDKELTTVDVAGPLGMGRMHLSLQNGELRIQSGNGATFESAAAWSELEGRLGAPLPAEYLRYWLRGLPAPGEYQWTAQEPSPVLEQAGWRIEYQEYARQDTNHGTTRVPVKFTATGGNARLRVVIDHWQLGIAAGSAP